MRWVTVNARGNGNCLYNAVFGSLFERANDTLYNLWNCLTGNKGPSREELVYRNQQSYNALQEAFMIMMRGKVADRLLVASSGTTINRLDEMIERFQITRRDAGDMLLEHYINAQEEWMIPMIWSVLDKRSTRKAFREECSRLIRIGGRTDNTDTLEVKDASKIDVDTIIDLLADLKGGGRGEGCNNVKMTMLTADVNMGAAVGHPRNYNEIVLINIANAHFMYISILELLNDSMLSALENSLKDYMPQNNKLAPKHTKVFHPDLRTNPWTNEEGKKTVYDPWVHKSVRSRTYNSGSLSRSLWSAAPLTSQSNSRPPLRANPRPSSPQASRRAPRLSSPQASRRAPRPSSPQASRRVPRPSSPQASRDAFAYTRSIARARPQVLMQRSQYIINDKLSPENVNAVRQAMRDALPVNSVEYRRQRAEHLSLVPGIIRQRALQAQVSRQKRATQAQSQQARQLAPTRASMIGSNGNAQTQALRRRVRQSQDEGTRDLIERIRIEDLYGNGYA